LSWTRERLAVIGNGRAQWIFADSANANKCAALDAAGGTVVRRFHRMLVELDPAAPAKPVVAPGVEIRLMGEGESDRRAVCRIVDTAFRDHFGSEAETFEQWDHDRLAACPDPALYWLATVDGEPAATLYAAELPAAGYIDTLGTLREFRSRGLGRALLLTAFNEFLRRDLRRVTLGVDATNPTGAYGLYESVGMTVTHEGWRYELPPANEARS
jgi:ribosomal protein S18 acetylase RimI-like enzyme